jgi:hypothetical protein
MTPAHALVISLPRRPERLDAFRARWDALALDIPLDVIPGVDTGSDMGCLHAHQAALRAGFPPPVLVLEDDAVFAPGLSLTLDPPKDWELLWLGGWHRFPPASVTGSWHRPVNMWGTHGYIVREPARFGAALQDAAGVKTPGTRGTALNTAPLTQYVHVPHLVGQAAGHSDISGVDWPVDRFWQPAE